MSKMFYRNRPKLYIILLSGVFIVFFLAVFKPFDIGTIPLLYLLGYGIITIVSCLFYYFFVTKKIIKIDDDIESYSFIKQLPIDILNIVTIGTLNLLYSAYVDKSAQLTWEWFWKYQFYTLAIGSILSVGVYFIVRNIRLKHKLAEMESLNRLLEQHVAKSKETAPLVFESETKNEKLVVLAHDLLFIKAEGNYCQFYFYLNSTLKSNLLRMSLKNAETIIENNCRFTRIHRSYIVNVDKIKRVSSESNTYKIWIDGFNEALPSSRQSISDLKKLIN